MRIFNADGSEAEMCGNGIRCFARWAYELGLVSTRRFSVETGAGILYPEILDNHRVRVDMGAPHLEAAVVPTTGFSGNPVVSEELVSSTGSHYKVTCVSMGNPHCVIFTDNVPDDEFLKKEGSAIEKDVHFPRKTNVEFVHPLGKQSFPYACMGTGNRNYHGLRHRMLRYGSCGHSQWTGQRRSLH